LPNYPLPFTALEIQGHLEKVASPDGAPVVDSNNLITSGAVAQALNEFEGGTGGTVELTKEQIEALGISINLEQIGDLDALTLDFDSITGDVSVNLEDITDIGNLFTKLCRWYFIKLHSHYGEFSWYNHLIRYK
jgi:hypothetical protein